MRLLKFFSVVALVLSVANVSFGKSPVNKTLIGGAAIKGYDPVNYFTAGKPAKGSKKIQYEYMGATWRFSSGENLKLFQSNPEKYAPQYGGYCAWAVSEGNTANIDPNSWKIVNDKLYLNFNKKIQKKWEADRDNNIIKADKNWPGVLEK